MAPTISASGVLLVQSEMLALETSSRIEIIDITERLMDIVHRHPVREGTASLFSLHTTCTIFVNESQQALAADMLTFLDHLVPSDADWLHDHPDHSACDRQNADAHLRSMLLGHSVTLQISGRELVLGQWQRVLVAELDGPRSRSLRLSLMGVA